MSTMCLLAVKTVDAENTHMELSPNWQVKFGVKQAWRWKKEHGTGKKRA